MGDKDMVSGDAGGLDYSSGGGESLATEALLNIEDGSEDSNDEWQRPAVRWSHPNRRESDRCLALLTMASVFFLIIVAISLIVAVCSSKQTQCKPKCETPECIQTSAAILGAMNLSVDPCKDFYQYSCGSWLDKVDLPEGYSRWGSFGEVDMGNKHILKKLFEKNDDKYRGSSSTAIRKALDFYAACSNKTHIEDARVRPMMEFIKELGGWSVLAADTKLGHWDDKKTWDMTTELISSHKHHTSPLFAMWVAADDKHSDTHILQFQQAGLGMGPQEMYLDNNTAMEDAYVTLGAKIATYLSFEDESDESELEEADVYETAMDRMKAILDLEVKLSKIFVPKEELQDPVKNYHKMTLKTFADMIPQLGIIKYMEARFGQKVPENEPVIVYTPSYFKKLNELLKKLNKRDLVEYMRWIAIKPMLHELNQAVIDIMLQFQKVADGTDTQPPRWQTCLGRTAGSFGFATGAMFVQKKVTPQIRTETKAMFKNIRDAFLENLHHLHWMDSETRKHAEEKAKAIIEMIGYPEWLEDGQKLNKYYEKFIVTRDDSFANNLNSKKFYFDKNFLQKWRHPVNKKEWQMSPAEVNAYYSPPFNQIVFPSGILQFPFYDFNMPVAYKYGAVGLVMGHELTHGFDNNGRNYNKDGNMVDWWKNATEKAYKEKTQCIVDQYSSYTIVDDLKNNGILTLGENIADNSGIRTAMRAFKQWQEHNKDETAYPGLHFTPDQLFYIGFSRVWCNYQTPESEKMSIYTDPHTNAKYRVIGVVSNSQEFAKAFNCPKGSPMNPEKKCVVW